MMYHSLEPCLVKSQGMAIKIGFIRLYLKVMKKRDTFIFITVFQKTLMNGKYHYADTLLLLHLKG